MIKQEALEQIQELIKEYYGDCLAVDIRVTCEGIRVNTEEKPYTTGACSMQTINGQWLPHKGEWI